LAKIDSEIARNQIKKSFLVLKTSLRERSFVLTGKYFLKVPPVFLRGGADRRRGFMLLFNYLINN
jgi:hypothetical protein